MDRIERIGPRPSAWLPAIDPDRDDAERRRREQRRRRAEPKGDSPLNVGGTVPSTLGGQSPEDDDGRPHVDVRA